MQIGSVTIGNEFGLWGMLVLVPFILMYLIKPKLKEKVIPSLMFLIKNNKQSIQASFLRNLMRNFLFIIQLIVLSSLAFSLAMPYIAIPYKSSSEHTVVVLDLSASMQAKGGSNTRFDYAIREVKPRLSGRVSIVLAQNQPLLLLKEGTRDEALNLLSRLKPKATTTNIGDAVAIAKDLLKGRKGKVIIASDFISDEDSDLLVMRRDLLSKGNSMEFVNVATAARNIGIVDMKVNKYDTKIRVKNYNDEPYDVKVKLVKDNEVLDETTVSMAAKSVEALSFDTPLGVSRIELEVNDDFDVDNSAYISTPLSKKIKVLLITNKDKSYLQYALEASNDIDLEIRNPPIINAFNINHDIIIIADVDKDEVIPSDIVDIKRYVERGGKLIVAAQDDLAQIDMLEMLPISLESISENSIICVDLINQFTNHLEGNKCFTNSKYFVGKIGEGSAAIASAGTNPIMIMRDLKLGTVFFYGIFDDVSNFKTQPAYPIFWNQLINYLVGTGNLMDYNFKTGVMLPIEEQTVKTPSIDMKTSMLFMEEAGLYELKDKVIAANLLSETESDISGEKIIDDAEAEISGDIERQEVDMSLELGLIALALILLWVELVYIKKRGDI